MARVQKSTDSSSLAEVVDRILDKGIVIDAWVKVSVSGWTQMEAQEAHSGSLPAVDAGRAGARRFPSRVPASENEEGFFVSSRGSAMREKGALNEAARRRLLWGLIG